MKIIKLFASLSIAIFAISCSSVTKNINSNQTKDFWKASFENFSGKEKLKFEQKPNHLVYLSSELENSLGYLKIFKNDLEIANLNKVNHTKIFLQNRSEIKIIGENAKGSFELKYPIFKEKNINIHYNTNIELLALSYFLINYDDFASIPDEQSFNIDGNEIKVKDLYAINLKIANEFKPYLKSKNLQIIKSHFDKTFYLQFSNLFLRIDNFPFAKFNGNNSQNLFASKEDADKFISAFNNLYEEIHFGEFLKKYKPFYDRMILEVSQNIPKENFIIEMEHFYNKGVENYNLYPSLTVPFSQGFGVGFENMIGNVFGCFSKPTEINNIQNLNLGFNNTTSLRTICVHEFGHSFVNPAVDKVDNKIIENKISLFESIKNKMSEQGYNEWKICLYEHFVRANEVIIAKLLKDDKKANEIMKDNVENRSFIYLPQIVEKLEYWYYNEYLEKSYEEKVSEIINTMK